jgi:hypothetical protein
MNKVINFINNKFSFNILWLFLLLPLSSFIHDYYGVIVSHDTPSLKLINTTEVSFSMYEFLFHIPMVALFFVLFCKTFDKFKVFLIVLIAYLIFNLGLIDSILFNYLQDHNLFPRALQMIDGKTNFQYVKVVIYMVVWPIALLKLLYVKFIKKRKLQLFQIFIFIFASSVMSTTTLFHYLDVSILYHYFKNKEQVWLTSIAEVKNEDAYKQLCSSFKLKCSNYIPPEGDKFYIHQEYDIIQGLDKALVKNNNQGNFISFGGFNNEHNEFLPTPIVLLKVGDRKRITIDEGTLTFDFFVARLLLTTLGCCATFVWSYGGLYLLMWHMNMIDKRKALNQERMKKVE